MSTIKTKFRTYQNACIETFTVKIDMVYCNRSGVSCNKCWSLPQYHTYGMSLWLYGYNICGWPCPVFHISPLYNFEICVPGEGLQHFLRLVFIILNNPDAARMLMPLTAIFITISVRTLLLYVLNIWQRRCPSPVTKYADEVELASLTNLYLSILLHYYAYNVTYTVGLSRPKHVVKRKKDNILISCIVTV
jgi:hypothetical protein